MRLRPAYFNVLYLIALALLIVGVRALGFRGVGHFGIVLITLLPAYWLVLFVTLRIFPVDLETTGDVRGLLYGDPQIDQIDSVPVEAEEPVTVPLPHRDEVPSDRVPEFRQIEESVDIAGLLLKIGALGLVAYVIWGAATAILYRVRPDLIEAKSGPRGFPITAQLQKQAIAFTSGSDEDWRCVITIGYDGVSPNRASIALPARGTRVIAYADFRAPSSTLEDAVLRSIARDQLWASCTGPTGRSHYGTLD